MSEEENNDKQHEPSQKKLDDARKKGEIPRSTDLSVAASYGGMLLVYAGFGATTLVFLCAEMAGFMEQAFLAKDMQGARNLTGGLMQSVWLVTGGWFLVPAGSVILVLIALKGFTFAPEKLLFKMSRISPLSNAKNKFGRSGIFEFLKSTLKLLIYSICLGLFLQARLSDIAAVTSMSSGSAVLLMFKMSAEFFFVAFLVALSVGGIDYLFQYNEHLRKNRMSDKEMRDEQKEAEGDPHMKGARRHKAQDLALNQMAARVPEATVIVVNPEHYAVALAWSRLPGSAPICVAKGVDEAAQTIKEIAREHNIPIHRDPPTARALYATTRIDKEIDPAHFKSVAAAIRFADQIKAKVKRGQF
ncbi:EscU/YscU/HrcU family type III secretion system export apparatus switch protein [Lentibacter sp.]|uniref:EscU/YscU/HrcU family type III secretion system export apparatus switch protein n=1 Tax=Lentibacter sp. TaxID=2024994 RepID=UPI003F6A3033